MKPANRDELGRFPPGVSGNPNGRPKGVSLTAAIIRNLSEEDADRIAKALIKRARLGGADLDRLLDRTDGKVANKHELEAVVTTQITYAADGEPRTPAVE